VQKFVSSINTLFGQKIENSKSKDRNGIRQQFRE